MALSSWMPHRHFGDTPYRGAQTPSGRPDTHKHELVGTDLMDDAPRGAPHAGSRASRGRAPAAAPHGRAQTRACRPPSAAACTPAQRAPAPRSLRDMHTASRAAWNSASNPHMRISDREAAQGLRCLTLGCNPKSLHRATSNAWVATSRLVPPHASWHRCTARRASHTNPRMKT